MIKMQHCFSITSPMRSVSEATKRHPVCLRKAQKDQAIPDNHAF
jgi:hypothetical protein